MGTSEETGLSERSEFTGFWRGVHARTDEPDLVFRINY
jgi:hypothetical protein